MTWSSYQESSLYDPLWDTEFVQDDGTVKTPRDFNKQRQETVLNRMLELGWISEAECSAAKAEKLLFVDTPEYAALHGLEIGENEEGEEEVLAAAGPPGGGQVQRPVGGLLPHASGHGHHVAGVGVQDGDGGIQ